MLSIKKIKQDYRKPLYQIIGGYNEINLRMHTFIMKDFTTYVVYNENELCYSTMAFIELLNMDFTYAEATEYLTSVLPHYFRLTNVKIYRTNNIIIDQMYDRNNERPWTRIN